MARHRRQTEPVPRSRSGFIGRRFERTGTEPITAQSALGVRLLLSGIFLPFFVVVTVLLALWWASSDTADSPSPGELGALTVFCALLTLLTLINLIAILRRRRRERGTPRQDDGAREEQ